ncbi:MAG TPA: GntR family transcriptional regulator [Gemmatimonadaceae bacterium]|nr:GntR family transcriptional regulator [Gemmatimonadaceae bacterium]
MPRAPRSQSPSPPGTSPNGRHPLAPPPSHGTPRLRQSASATAYHRLREQIIACARAPGERLTEGEVAERMRLGKTPVREALRRLVQEGLVQVLPRRAYVVAPITARDVDDVCGLRLIVEPAAVALAAARMPPGDIATLERWCHVGYDVANPATVRAFHHANRAFHTTIAESCGNQRLAALVAQLLIESHRVIQFGMLRLPHSDQAVHGHEALVGALRNRDASAARRLVAGEIRATRRMVLDSLRHDAGGRLS